MDCERQFQLRAGNRSAGCETRRRSGIANGCAPAADRPERSPIFSDHGFFRFRPSSTLKPENAEVPEAAGKIRFGDLAHVMAEWSGT